MYLRRYGECRTPQSCQIQWVVLGARNMHPKFHRLYRITFQVWRAYRIASGAILPRTACLGKYGYFMKRKVLSYFFRICSKDFVIITLACVYQKAAASKNKET